MCSTQIKAKIPACESYSAWCSTIRAAGKANALFTLLPFLHGGFPAPQLFQDTHTGTRCPVVNSADLRRHAEWLNAQGHL